MAAADILPLFICNKISLELTKKSNKPKHHTRNSFQLDYKFTLNKIHNWMKHHNKLLVRCKIIKKIPTSR